MNVNWREVWGKQSFLRVREGEREGEQDRERIGRSVRVTIQNKKETERGDRCGEKKV